MWNFQNFSPKEFSIENIKFEEKFYSKVCRILPFDKACQVITLLKPRQKKVFKQSLHRILICLSLHLIGPKLECIAQE